MKITRRDIHQLLKGQNRSAPKDEMEWDAARALHRLRAEHGFHANHLTNERIVVSLPSRSLRWRVFVAVPALTGAVLAMIFAIGLRQDALGVVESVDGVLYRIVDGRNQSIRPGERIAVRDRVRAEGGASSTILLDNGSRLEMRAKSEFSADRAADGMRILLSEGDVIIDATKQRNGPLYVQTKDVTVSVQDNVFFVNSEEHGSRVAVIGGEAHVQQGTMLKKLLTGEQIATGLSAEAIPVAEEIAWSRFAPTHLAMLQQLATRLTPAASKAQGSPDATAAPSFEVASIRPNNDPTCRQFLCGVTTQPRSGRLILQNQNLLSMIRTAYGVRAETIVGGPDWRDKDKFDIEAKAEGPVPDATLFLMLRSLLTERFKLVLNRELRVMPMYSLVATKGVEKLQKIREENAPPAGNAAGGGGRGGCAGSIGNVGSLQRLGDATAYAAGMRQFGGRGSTAQLANFLMSLVGCRPVLDNTDIAGTFEMKVEWTLSPHQELLAPGGPDPAMEAALEDQLGIKLVTKDAPGEVLVIVSVQRPAVN